MEGVAVINGDGKQCDGKFDVIHVGAAAATMPATLVDGLNEDGMMMIPIGVEDQYIYLITKTGGRITSKRLFGVRYVPLT